MRPVWLILLSLLVLVGCGRSSTGGSTGADEDSEAPAETAIKAYAIADLPAVSEPSAPQDMGWVVFNAPAGWQELPKGVRSLAVFVPAAGSATELPRISIAAAPSPIADLTTVNADNAEAFAEQMKEVMTKEGRQFKESVKPLQLGDNLWVRHVRMARFKDAAAAVQSLQTVRGGRLYTIELTVAADKELKYANSLLKNRDQAYAIAAHMKFPKEPVAAAVPPATEEANPQPAAPNPEPATPAADEKKAE